MNMDQTYLYYLWQKVAFQIVHKTTIWVLLVFFTTNRVSWYLATLLDKHNARGLEAKLAHRPRVYNFRPSLMVIPLYYGLIKVSRGLRRGRHNACPLLLFTNIFNDYIN